MSFFSSLATSAAKGFATGAGKAAVGALTGSGGSVQSPVQTAGTAKLAKEYVSDDSNGSDYQRKRKADGKVKKAETSLGRKEQLSFGRDGSDQRSAWELAMMWDNFLSEGSERK
jgi:hypothetical protein